MVETVDDIWERTEYLNFRDRGLVGEGRKTRVYDIISRLKGTKLGEVRWYALWRQYVFYPHNALFDKNCLRDIADYCELKTKQYREANPPKRKTWQQKRKERQKALLTFK